MSKPITHNLQPLQQFVDKDYEVQSIIDHLTEIKEEYIALHLKDPELCSPRPWVADNVFFLNEFRAAFKQMLASMP